MQAAGVGGVGRSSACAVVVAQVVRAVRVFWLGEKKIMFTISGFFEQSHLAEEFQMRFLEPHQVKKKTASDNKSDAGFFWTAFAFPCQVSLAFFC